MAAESILYSDIRGYVFGSLLTEQNQIKITRDPGNREVMTTSKGISGIAPGAAFTRIQVRSAVPAAGVEFDPGPYMASRTKVPFTFFRGSKRLTGEFWIMGDDTSHAANNESELNFDLLAPSVLQWQ